MAREIERRFLVADTAFLAGRTGERIVQGYVAKEPGAMSTRVRIRGNAAYLTLKGPHCGMSRDEFEYCIPLEDATQILTVHCGTRIVAKTRHLIEFSGHVFEVDVFEGRHKGLVIAEVELCCESEPVALPVWLGREITCDSRYGNFSLAMFEGPLPPVDWPRALPPSPATPPRALEAHC